MEHTEIEAQGRVAGYLAGSLPAAEADAFEQHLLFCAECQERLELEAALRDGVRAWSAERAVQQAAVGAGLLAWLARHGRSHGLALALTVVFVVVAVPGSLLLREVARLRGELDRAHAAAGAAAGLAAGTATAAGTPAETAAGTATGVSPVGTAATTGANTATGSPVAGAPATRRMAELEARLAAADQAAASAAAGERREHDDRARLERELAAERQPRIDTPIVTLSALRGGGDGGGEAAAPAVRVPLPAATGAGSGSGSGSGGTAGSGSGSGITAGAGAAAGRPGAWITLVLDLDTPHHAAYAVTLAPAGRPAIWRGEGLHPDAADALTLSLPASLLAPGDYEVRAFGLAAGAPPVAVARFTFRAVSRR